MALWTKAKTCDKAGFESRLCQVQQSGKIGVNQRNLRLINDLRLRKITYEKINLFLQNEPNFRKSQVNVNALLTREYVQMDTWSIRKNEPKKNPNKAKTNPIRTQFKPKQTQFHPTLGLLKLVSTSQIAKSFLNILRPPCDIAGKMGLTMHKETRSISRAKTGNRAFFHIDKRGLEMYHNMIEFYCGTPF